MTTEETCVKCGRKIPAHHQNTTIQGMHPGCWRKANGLPPIHN